jgi:hypothetical protein
MREELRAMLVAYLAPWLADEGREADRGQPLAVARAADRETTARGATREERRVTSNE